MNSSIKIGYKGVIHRLRIDVNEFSFGLLENMFQETFGLDETEYVIQYFDACKTRHVVRDQTSLQEMMTLHGENENSMKFLAQSKNSAALYEATEPILKAIEKLMEQLNQAMKKLMDKAKDEDWEGQCRRSVSATSEVLQKAAVDARESIHACKEKVEEFPYNEVLQETTETIKKAAMDISIFAQQFAEDVAKELREVVPADNDETAAAKETEPVAAPVEVTTPAVAPTIVVSSEAQTPAPATVETQTSTDDDWAVVANTEEEVVVVAEEVAVVSEEVAAVSEAVAAWKVQLEMIRSIFPECNMENTCDLLEKYKGEVNVVLNELAEM